MLSAVFYGFCRLIVFQQTVDRRAGAGNPDRGIAGDDPAAAVHQQVGREHIKVANRTEDSRRSEVEQETFAGDFTLADHFDPPLPGRPYRQGNEYDLFPFVFFLQFGQLRHLGDAGRAPRAPDVDVDYFPGIPGAKQAENVFS